MIKHSAHQYFLLLALLTALCLQDTAASWAAQPAPSGESASGFAHADPAKGAVTAPSAGTASAPAIPAPTLPLTLTNPAATLAPIATQLGQTIQTLVGVPTTQPQPNPDEDVNAPVTNSLAASVMTSVVQLFDGLKKNSKAFASTISAWPDLEDWVQRQSNDPHRQVLWQALADDTLMIIGAPLLGGLALVFFLLPLRMNLRRQRPISTYGKAAYLFILLGLRLLPVVAFVGVSLLLLDQNEPRNLPRFILLNTIDALGLGYAISQIWRTVFAPNTEHLRLISSNTEQAQNACAWFSAFSILIIYGYFFLDAVTALHMPASFILLFQNSLSLVLMIMTMIIILKTRDRVAAILHGKDIDEEPSLSRALRIGLSRNWHRLALVYLLIAFAVSALGIENGLGVMLRGTIISLVIVVTARLVFIMLDRWKAEAESNGALIHRYLLAFLLRPLIGIVVGAAIAATWGLHVGRVIASPSGQQATGAFISVVATLFILTVIYELLNNAIERHLNRRDKSTKAPTATARARTLLPMLRTTVFFLFCLVTVLTLLSAIGINLAPVLAGAGVVGVAIGFGSQTIIKDFLSGLFNVVENTIAVGDLVKVGEFFGSVEALSIRTLRLRDYDGSLHILPFSEVSKITNLSRGYGFALVDVAVSYDSNLDHVMAILREIGATIQEDPVFKRVILEPIEVMGVETLGNYAITIRARLRTRPGKQADVRRFLLQRIKERFEIEKIVMPYPTITSINRTTE